jgi:16S rRNA (cytosine967-C5)-methyltransferase
VRARRAALDVLAAVRRRDAYANLVLPSVLAARGLHGPEAARATDLAYGTLRGLGTFDRIIEACSSRPVRRIDPSALDVLRLGVYQMLLTRTPVHAAVSTSVDLVREQSSARATGFVNAVLRASASRSLDGWAERLTAPGTIDALAFRHLHPAWVVEAFADALGDDRERVVDVLVADNLPPAVSLIAVPGRATVAELVEAGATRGRWAPTAAVLEAGGDPRRVPAIAQGRARVQDEGSQLVALALTRAQVSPDVAARPWLDVCAGPGGKATLLAGVADSQGSVVLAAEKHAHRARLVARSVHGAGLDAAAAGVQADGRSGPWPPRAFGRVLLDAPCTGIGALRRRPESRWRRRPADLDQLVPLQRALLEASLDAVVDGGVLAYVTCSPHVEETVAVVEHVLSRRSDVHVEPAVQLVPDVPSSDRGPYVQLWPDLHGTDAMFLAVLRRRIGTHA